jgi:hypothetical protein
VNIVDFDEVLNHVLNVVGAVQTGALETPFAIVRNIFLYFLAPAEQIVRVVECGIFAQLHVGDCQLP